MATVPAFPDRRLTTLVAREPARKITVDEYHRMIDAGILDEDEHVELLEGAIVRVSPQKRPHARVIQRLTRHLNRTLGDAFEVMPQLPLTLGDFSEPEPDLAVVRAEDARSNEEHPRTALLVVEVARSTLNKDRNLKAALYARFGIAEYWIVNLKDACVEVYRDPDTRAGRYRTASTLSLDDTLTCESVPGLTVSVSALLGD
jgi:Uma2 family endonuclease